MDTRASQLDAKRLGQEEQYDTPTARLNRLREGDVVTAKVRRFDPSSDSKARYETYEVPFSKWMRVLDVLNHIGEDLGYDLAYRWVCGVRKCGTCAVRVNGREVLACWEPVEPTMIIEPLRHLPVIRDLVVDRTPYENRVYSMSPWLHRGEPYPGFPERLPRREMALATRALDCISCMACYSACPVLDLGDHVKFSGPAPLVQFAQTALDPRDASDRGRIALETAAIFQCVSCYKCQEVCPVEIPIVSDIIEPLKAKAFQSAPGKARHQRAFLEIIRARGLIDPSMLILKTQGLGVLRRPIRALKLLLRGKIDPLRTFFGRPDASIERIRTLFAKVTRS